MMVRCKLRKKKYQAKQSLLKHIEIGETGREPVMWWRCGEYNVQPSALGQVRNVHHTVPVGGTRTRNSASSGTAIQKFQHT
jgi:bisphosphoglycerate-dependent phosphoglycerate mutase